jgi:CBS domain-containing protein
MLVKDIMKAPVWVSADDTLQTAIHRLQAEKVGCLPVCDGERVLGMITDRDILMRCVARGGSIRDMRTQDAMTSGVRSCCEDDPVEEAARIMSEHQLRRLAVLDKEDRLVGIISAIDLIGGRSSRAQYQVSFYKEIVDGYGRPHHVELKRVTVGAGHSKEAAVELAIQLVEKEKKTAWNHFADGYEVSELRVGPSAEIAEPVEDTSEPNRDREPRP